MTKRAWIIFVTVCVVLFGAIVIFSKKDSIDVSNVDPNKIVTSGQYTDHVFGKKDSKVVLIEYGDYQCPFCGQAEPQVSAVVHEYKDQIAFVFRNFPLTTNHPNALAAATAAEAVAKESNDLFWKMHDTLYANQGLWSNADVKQRKDFFERFAHEVGAQIGPYRDNLENKATTNKINFDLALGTKLGLSATPAFYLNGERLNDTIYNDIVNGKGDKLRAKIQDLIKKNQKS